MLLGHVVVFLLFTIGVIVLIWGLISWRRDEAEYENTLARLAGLQKIILEDLDGRHADEIRELYRRHPF